MTEFDHELIAALAEGTLPAAEAADLEARIAADPVASAELEAQRTALAALAAATPPVLDDLERRRLHRSVAAELDLVLPTTSPRTRRRFDVNWMALGTAAAVLLGVALVAPVLSLLNTSGDSGADITSTVVAALETTPELEAADGDEELRAADEEDITLSEAPVAAEPADTTAAATTVAPETTVVTEAAAGDADFLLFGEAELPDLGELEGDLTQALARVAAPPVPFSDDAAGDFPCIDTIGVELAARQLEPESTAVFVVGRATRDEVPVFVIQLGEPDPSRELILLAAGDCTLVDSVSIE